VVDDFVVVHLVGDLELVLVAFHEVGQFFLPLVGVFLLLDDAFLQLLEALVRVSYV